MFRVVLSVVLGLCAAAKPGKCPGLYRLKSKEASALQKNCGMGADFRAAQLPSGDAFQDQFPWSARLAIRHKGVICSASLVSPWHAITLASCMGLENGKLNISKDVFEIAIGKPCHSYYSGTSAAAKDCEKHDQCSEGGCKNVTDKTFVVRSVTVPLSSFQYSIHQNGSIPASDLAVLQFDGPIGITPICTPGLRDDIESYTVYGYNCPDSSTYMMEEDGEWAHKKYDEPGRNENVLQLKYVKDAEVIESWACEWTKVANGPQHQCTNLRFRAFDSIRDSVLPCNGDRGGGLLGVGERSDILYGIYMGRVQPCRKNGTCVKHLYLDIFEFSDILCSYFNICPVGRKPKTDVEKVVFAKKRKVYTSDDAKSLAAFSRCK